MGNGNVPNWPQPGGGTSPERPPSVRTGRVIFRSSSGEACCVAVDPDTLTGRAANGQSLLVLDNLPTGPATVIVSAFATDFAPAVDGITETCATLPPQVGQVCDPTRLSTPVFESDPLPVVIQQGTQIQIADLIIRALPFLVNFQPGQDETVHNLVQFAFTMADAVNGVSADSIALTVTVTIDAPDQTPPFRSLTKRVPLSLTACNDAGSPTCSPSGDLGVKGFQASGTSLRLPPGSADVHIVAQNLDTPTGSVDLAYVIDVSPDETAPTPTAVPATPSSGTVTPASGEAVPGAEAEPAATPVPSAGVSGPSGTPVSSTSATQPHLASHGSSSSVVLRSGATPTPTP